MNFNLYVENESHGLKGHDKMSEMSMLDVIT